MKTSFFLLFSLLVLFHHSSTHAFSFFHPKKTKKEKTNPITLDGLFSTWFNLPKIEENILKILLHTNQELKSIYSQNSNTRIRRRLKRMIFTNYEFIHIYEKNAFTITEKTWNTWLGMSRGQYQESVKLTNYKTEKYEYFQHIHMQANLIASLKLVALKNENIKLNYKLLLKNSEGQLDDFPHLDQVFEEKKEKILNIHLNLSCFMRIFLSRLRHKTLIYDPSK